MSGHDGKFSAAHRVARWRTSRQEAAEALSAHEENLYYVAREEGVQQQCEASIAVAHRVREILKGGPLTEVSRQAIRFLEKAMQVWAEDSAGALPEEAESSGAAATGRGNDPEALGNSGAEEAVSEPDR